MCRRAEKTKKVPLISVPKIFLSFFCGRDWISLFARLFFPDPCSVVNVLLVLVVNDFQHKVLSSNKACSASSAECSALTGLTSSFPGLPSRVPAAAFAAAKRIRCSSFNNLQGHAPGVSDPLRTPCHNAKLVHSRIQTDFDPLCWFSLFPSLALFC